MSGRPRREVRKVIVRSSSSSASDSGETSDDDMGTTNGGNEDEDEEVSSSAHQQGGAEEDEEEEEDESMGAQVVEEVASKRRKKPITISLKGAKQCKVCKAADHQAGFVGSIYMDCPNKPCYLCKRPGHTTATCPHRIASEHGVSPAPRRSSLGLVDFIHERQLRGHIPLVRPKAPIPNKVDAAIIKLHSRRVTWLEFHPTKDNILVSGDKRGQIGVWDFDKVYDKNVYNAHTCIVNSIKFSPRNDGTLYSSSSDGTVCLTDLEIGLSEGLIDVNPNGWHGASTWRMIYGMDVNAKRELILAGDCFGYLYQLDMRTKAACKKPQLIHKKGTKIVSLHTNPVEPDVFITAGNDHTARIWDLRQLGTNTPLAELSHPRVVNSAYFSPISGNKILTTCQDNRIRVWDCIFSDLGAPSREIVHSHDFNRYLTCFRAEWDPKDCTECLTVIGRYISDDYNGVALHPVDFIDVSTGQLVAEAVDHTITTISPVNKLHPRRDILATGSSRSLFIWSPKGDFQQEAITKKIESINIFNVEDDAKKRKGKGGGKLEEEDDDDCFRQIKSKAKAK